MRILVCGGRAYQDTLAVDRALAALREKHGIEAIVHGDAPGADTIGAKWAEMNGIPDEPWRADWKRYGDSAGPIRNSRMLAFGRVDAVVAFPGGSGTADLTRKATGVGFPVWEPEA